MSCDVGEVTERFENELSYDYNYELCSFSNSSVALPTSQLILQPFRCFTYVTAHSPTLLSFLLRQRFSLTSSELRSFSKLPVASPMLQLIFQPFRHFTYFTVHSPTIPSLHLRHSSFSNSSVALTTSQIILQPFRCFTYLTAHYSTLPSLYLRHSSLSNPFFASPTSQALHLRHLASSPWQGQTVSPLVHRDGILNHELSHEKYANVTEGVR